MGENFFTHLALAKLKKKSTLTRNLTFYIEIFWPTTFSHHYGFIQKTKFFLFKFLFKKIPKMVNTLKTREFATNLENIENDNQATAKRKKGV